MASCIRDIVERFDLGITCFWCFHLVLYVGGGGIDKIRFFVSFWESMLEPAAVLVRRNMGNAWLAEEMVGHLYPMGRHENEQADQI